MAKLYQVWNGQQATAITGPVPITTGTAVKTMIQVQTSASKELRICEWWWEADGSTAAVPGVVELNFAGNVTTPATVTAYNATNDIRRYEPNSPISLVTVGTTASGFTASAEGTVSAGYAIPHQVPPTSGIYIQYPFAREPELQVSSNLKLRNKLAAAVNAICGIVWEE